MPPEQRAQMEKALSKIQGMQGMQLQAQETPLTYQKTSQRETVNGYPCTRVDALRGQKKVRELWVTSIDALAMPEADYQTLMAMQEMVRSFASQFGSGHVPSFVESSLDGIPVRTVHFGDDGKVDSQQELKSISRDALDPALFEIPKGYKKREMPSMGKR